VKLENWFNRFYADGKFLPQVWFVNIRACSGAIGTAK